MRRKTEILLLLLIGLVPIFWLGKGQLLMGHDSGFRFDYGSYLNSLVYSWDSSVNFGSSVSLFKGFLITQLPEILLYYLGLPLHVIEVFVFIFWFMLMLFSMYVFTVSFFPEKRYWILRCFSSVLFAVNFFVLQAWFIAERAKFSLYAAIPLGLTIIIKTVNGSFSLTKGVLLFALLSFFLNGGGLPPSYGGLFGAYAVTFLVLAIIKFRKKGVRGMVRPLSVLVLFLATFILVNFYWILPQIYAYFSSYHQSLQLGGGIEGILAWEDAVTKYASLPNLFRLQGIPDWYNNINHPYANYYLERPSLIIISFLPFFFIVFGLSSIKKLITLQRTSIIFIALFIMLISILMTAGSHPPFGVLYTLMLKYLPGFTIFRSAFYKFGPSFWFSVAFLSGFFINFLIYKYFKSPKRRSALGWLAISAILLYHLPFLISNFFDWHKEYSTRVRIPSYVNEMKVYVDANLKKSDRILLLPPNSEQFRADSYQWGFWSLDILPRLFIGNPIFVNDSQELKVTQSIYENIRKKNYEIVEKLFLNTGIRYIILREDLSEVETQNKIAAKDFISSYKNLREIKKFGNWSLYKLTLPDYEIVQVPTTFTKSTSSEEAIGMLTQIGGSESASYLINESILDTNNLYSQQAIEFSYCKHCTVPGQEDLTNSVKLPNQYFFPDSFFAFLSDLQEESILKNSHGNQSIIDANLIFIGRRVNEVAWLSKENKTFYKKYAADLVSKINNNCSAIEFYIGKLPESEMIFSSNRANSYLERYSFILKSFVEQEQDVARITIGIMREIDACAEKIRKFGWIVNSSSTYPYFVNIEKPSIYEIKTDISGTDYKMFLNGSAITEGEVELSKTFNRLVIELDKESSVVPRIVVFSSSESATIKKPEIRYSEDNPVRFYVDVKSAEDPYVVKFSKRFDVGWKAFFEDRQDDNSHLIQKVKLDGYANGWYVERKGDYRLIIEYRPFTLFKYGVVVSLVSMIGILIVAFFAREKNK